MPPDLIRGWIPVRVKKTRQNKNLERNRDSIRWDCALGKNAALPSLDAALRAQATRLRSIDLLVGVNAPQPLLFDPAIKPVAGDAAPACIAMLDLRDDAGLQAGGDRAFRIRAIINRCQLVLG